MFFVGVCWYGGMYKASSVSVPLLDLFPPKRMLKSQTPCIGWGVVLEQLQRCWGTFLSRGGKCILFTVYNFDKQTRKCSRMKHSLPWPRFTIFLSTIILYVYNTWWAGCTAKHARTRKSDDFGLIHKESRHSDNYVLNYRQKTSPLFIVASARIKTTIKKFLSIYYIDTVVSSVH